MTELEDYSMQQLHEMIAETETTLADLKAELQLRQLSAQEHEIEHLDEHMNKAVVSLKAIRDFLKQLLDDYRSEA